MLTREIHDKCPECGRPRDRFKGSFMACPCFYYNQRKILDQENLRDSKPKKVKTK